MDGFLDSFGVSATVTPVDGSPVSTKVIWHGYPEFEDVPVGNDFSRSEPRRLMSIQREAVSSLPRGSSIVAPERKGETPKTWEVDGIEMIDADHFRVKVILKTAVPFSVP